MTKYYVYSKRLSDNGTEQIFVSKPEEFARKAYDPDTTEYTGIVVEAQNADEAYIVYNRPALSSVYSMADEPPEIIKVRKLFEHYSKARAKKSVTELGAVLATTFQSMNVAISEMARQLNLQTGQTEVPVEEIYDKIKEKLIHEFRLFEYKS